MLLLLLSHLVACDFNNIFPFAGSCVSELCIFDTYIDRHVQVCANSWDEQRRVRRRESEPASERKWIGGNFRDTSTKLPSICYDKLAFSQRHFGRLKRIFSKPLVNVQVKESSEMDVRVFRLCRCRADAEENAHTPTVTDIWMSLLRLIVVVHAE